MGRYFSVGTHFMLSAWAGTGCALCVQKRIRRKLNTKQPNSHAVLWKMYSNKPLFKIIPYPLSKLQTRKVEFLTTQRKTKKGVIAWSTREDPPFHLFSCGLRLKCVVVGGWSWVVRAKSKNRKRGAVGYFEFFSRSSRKRRKNPFFQLRKNLLSALSQIDRTDLIYIGPSRKVPWRGFKSLSALCVFFNQPLHQGRARWGRTCLW